MDKLPRLLRSRRRLPGGRIRSRGEREAGASDLRRLIAWGLFLLGVAAGAEEASAPDPVAPALEGEATDEEPTNDEGELLAYRVQVAGADGVRRPTRTSRSRRSRPGKPRS